MAALLDVLQGRLGSGWDARLIHREVAPHIDDRGDVLDHHGALLDAGATGTAGPERFVFDVVADKLALEVRGGVLAGDEKRAGVVHVGLHVLDDGHRRERLAGRPGGADGRASATADAGVSVEELLPGKVLELAGAEALALLHQLFEVAHRRQVELGGGTLEKAVDWCEEDVAELGHRHEGEQGERADDMEPPDDLVNVEGRIGADAAEGFCEEPARGGPVGPVFVACRDFVASDSQAFDKDAGEEHEAEKTYDQPIFGVSAVPGELGRRSDVAAVNGHADADEPDDAEEVADKAVAEVDPALQEGVLGILAEDQREVVIEREEDGDDEEDDEAGVDAPVHHAGEFVVLHAAGASAHGKHVGEARADVVEHGLGLPEAPDAQPLDKCANDDCDADRENEIHQPWDVDVEEDFARSGCGTGGLQGGDAAEDYEGDEQAAEAAPQPDRA